MADFGNRVLADLTIGRAIDRDHVLGVRHHRLAMVFCINVRLSRAAACGALS
jgi:hypothetical protein